jgi:hypothetical protein
MVGLEIESARSHALCFFNRSLQQAATDAPSLVSGRDRHLCHFEFVLAYTDSERLPRRFTAELRDDEQGLVNLIIDGRSFGAKLKDNAYESDGYRFDDNLPPRCSHDAGMVSGSSCPA